MTKINEAASYFVKGVTSIAYQLLSIFILLMLFKFILQLNSFKNP